MEEQIRRIEEMERCLDASEQAVSALSQALNEFERTQTQLRQLSDYYSGPLWMEDFEADEAGKLPGDLKRGVLSEDAVYDLLTENRELLVRMLDLVAGALKTDRI